MFRSLFSVDILHEEARGRRQRINDEKYDAKCVKFNNNQIEDVTELMSVLEQIILQPAAITWIDMSFNKLQKIDPVSKLHCNVQSTFLTQIHILGKVCTF